MPSTYTESHRKSHQKRRESELLRFRTYYLNNKERISADRKEKYKQKKLLLAASNATAAETNIQTEVI